MTWPVPTSLSPSRIEAYITCPMRFRFASIQKLADPSGPPAVKGNIVHRALELLYEGPPEHRNAEMATGIYLTRALAEHLDDIDALGLADNEKVNLSNQAERCIERYFEMESPDAVSAAGNELRLSVDVGGIEVRGIIDRLDVVDGAMEVVDYKSGKAPSERYVATKMGPVGVYSMFIEEHFGELPRRVRLLYLTDRVEVSRDVSAQQVAFTRRRIAAVHESIARSCERDDFRPRPSKLCNTCTFKPICPAHGGSPESVLAVDPGKEHDDRYE